jgi:hypothetical protein
MPACSSFTWCGGVIRLSGQSAEKRRVPLRARTSSDDRRWCKRPAKSGSDSAGGFSYNWSPKLRRRCASRARSSAALAP